ncbi:hypothetical protein NADFUDRAFT_52411 [Nadsonia fulvescens var. elongata DSM 6958]|uniref:STAS domain-containing protein n=1 Tax=Nadsonia fulvescens var. elongata DSM 6958 TaxID=857566 RepID=A0A1E3PHE3_9ASCO|nr:hypothetical protein NADFUDRAFT_52411 [Nadsonia fulvescens var. elongata DSM 6958]
MVNENSPLLQASSQSASRAPITGLTNASLLRKNCSPTATPSRVSLSRETTDQESFDGNINSKLNHPSSSSSLEIVNSIILVPNSPDSEQQKPDLISYWSYYIPSLEWIPLYSKGPLVGDIAAGLTLASFQIPLSLSYATSLAYLPPVSGLYALAIPPLVYAFLGSVPHMVVGPEAAISLVVGQMMGPYLHPSNPETSISPMDVTGIISGSAGGILLAAGLFRFGFLDSVLSRALLRGFISAVGAVMIIDQLVNQLGLGHLLHDIYGETTTFNKILFLFQYFNQMHRLTALFSFTGVLIIIAIRGLKRIFKNRFKWVIFVPEILIVVVTSIIIVGYYNMDQDGIAIIGLVDKTKVSFRLPITPSTWPEFKSNFSTSFIIAVLGFFESTIAAKSLGSMFNFNISTNRELVALGVTNLVSSLVGALPAFGGYGRSKINAMSGATTQMSGVVLSVVTFGFIFFFMPYIYYLPKCILSSVISVVGLSLLEEAPNDIAFYWKVGGYSELFTLFITLFTTIFWSVETGIAVGVGFSLVRVIYHVTQPRIQILGRIPGTNMYRNADLIPTNGGSLEEFKGCLIVKIPEPLTFANTGDLSNRLRRLELYGSMKVHPSHPRIRDEAMTQYLIIDLNGMTDIDTSAAQILLEIVSGYKNRGIKIYFTRVPEADRILELFKKSGIEELVRASESRCYFDSIDEVLQLIDEESSLGS